MITLFGQIKARVLEADLPYLRLRPQRKLSRSAQIIHLILGGRTFRIKVCALEKDADGATWVKMLDAFSQNAELSAHLALDLDGPTERRTAEREKVQLAVRSPDLPGFRGTTLDVSETGLRLLTTESVPVGMRVRMEIDDRQIGQRPTDISGISVWSAKRFGDTYQVGIRLLHPA